MERFPASLKGWRQQRRLSQMQLAGRADISTRHASFLESGRAAPSRSMVQRLASALDLPLAESNALFLAAGFAPPFSQSAKPLAELPHVGRAINFILEKQQPYPAIVVDGHWNIIQRNDATSKFFAPFHAGYSAPEDVANNAMHTVFHPGALRQFMTDWQVIAPAFLQLLHRDVAKGSEVAAKLLADVFKYPGVAKLAAAESQPTDEFPLLTMRLQRDDYRICFFSTFTSFAMPTDVGAEQMKIECFFPADEETERWAIRYAE
jgi:transcriptional regulator with XRE-family HTH domain